jgi:hypothetical protein
MGKVGGQRNFGYGKRMDWAGKNALSDRYGDGHFATRAAHGERWGQFVAYAKSVGITDARAITRESILRYGASLAGQVGAGEMAVAYAQNLLSSVNVVLESLRGDRERRVSPADLVGERSHVRTRAPAGLERASVDAVVAALRDRGEARVAAVVELARDLGLRFREASLIDARTALSQAREFGRVNVTDGTKGGRGREVDRWVPVTDSARQSLQRAVAIQGRARNLIPPGTRFHQWRNHAYGIWAPFSKAHGLAGFHDLRAAFACERYQQITAHPAPVVAGRRLANRASERKAREAISLELGHGRPEVAAAYLGSGR